MQSITAFVSGIILIHFASYKQINFNLRYFCMDDCLGAASRNNSKWTTRFDFCVFFYHQALQIYQYFFFCLSRALKVFAIDDSVCLFTVKRSVKAKKSNCKSKHCSEWLLSTYCEWSCISTHLKATESKVGCGLVFIISNSTKWKRR